MPSKHARAGVQELQKTTRTSRRDALFQRENGCIVFCCWQQESSRCRCAANFHIPTSFRGPAARYKSGRHCMHAHARFDPDIGQVRVGHQRLCLFLALSSMSGAQQRHGFDTPCRHANHFTPRQQQQQQTTTKLNFVATHTTRPKARAASTARATTTVATQRCLDL